MISVSIRRAVIPSLVAVADVTVDTMLADNSHYVRERAGDRTQLFAGIGFCWKYNGRGDSCLTGGRGEGSVTRDRLEFPC